MHGCRFQNHIKGNEMNEKYYEVYLTSGNIARVKADVMYSGCGSYTLEKNGKVVARFSCVTVEGWVKEDGKIS